MRIPAATYRIQFNPAFGFQAAKNIVSYLTELGISDIYASPIFKARKGSTHGYDVVDPNQLNPELGTQEEFDALIDDLQQREMGWVQDIVPNHMAYDSQNRYLMDVLENGPDSEYFEYFDIDWEHPYEDIKGRVLTPLLGDFYGNCLENGEIQLKYEEGQLTVNYYDFQLPIRTESYAPLITHDIERLAQSLGRKNPDFVKLLGVLYILKNVTAAESIVQRKDQTSFVRGILWELYTDKAEIREFIDQNIKIFNGEVGKPESFNLLDSLLTEQFFRLSFWKVGAEELNYRRFFTINELISLKVEVPRVFEVTHKLIRKLVQSKKFTGLRVDHIDGLYNPTQYLHQLRQEMGDTYITVEKILELEKEYFSRYEELPRNWPIQGTSGYDFLNCVNSIFCFSKGQNNLKFDSIYAQFIGKQLHYERLAAQKKRLIADKNLAGDIENLAHLLKRISGKYRYGRDFTLHGLQKAILEVLVLFPVYRTYTDEQGVRERDKGYVQEVIENAKQQIPQLINELNFLERILLLEFEETLADEEKAEWLHFVMKLQQFSGPLTAKGVEDTTLYVYNRLLSLNEVGGTPPQFGITVSAFHNFNQQWQDHWPHSMNATSSHDTKRSEDVRARINVISEIPEEWENQVKTWSILNRPHKSLVKGKEVPDANDEYFLYQTLIGAFPFADHEYSQFVERIKDYVVKAVREAKVYTAWLRPDTEYEEGFAQFVEKILQTSEENKFLQEFRPFQQRVAYYGMFNSLSQTFLKITSPGVPDLYQGTELWDLSLVDPDNRRPVDFEQRRAFLQEIKERSKADILNLISDLMATSENGKIKLFLTTKALEARSQYLEVFQQGTYVPLQVMGQYQEHIIAFARHYGPSTVVAIAPRFLTNLVEPSIYPLGENIWQDTRLEIPQGLRATWQDAFTQEILPESDTIAISQALQNFPIALLISQNEQVDLKRNKY